MNCRVHLCPSAPECEYTLEMNKVHVHIEQDREQDIVRNKRLNKVR